MYETDEDLAAMQAVMDESYTRGGEHLLAVHEPRWRVTAAEVAERMQGMCLLVLATSTADGRPLTSPVDGFLVRGRFCFSSSPESVRFRHLRQRPAVSATHLPQEEFAVTVHGTAREIDFEDDEDEIASALRQACLEQYGEAWLQWSDGAVFAAIEPERLLAFRIDEAALTDEERPMRE
jgi:hypothetical protein